MRITSLIVGILLSGGVVYAQNKKVTKPSMVSAAIIEEGKLLISKSDCLACHKDDAKMLGPSYLEIAKKYPATEVNYKLLSKKIMEGGSGNWGKIPMSPHANLAPADAKKMVQYILALKPKAK